MRDNAVLHFFFRKNLRITPKAGGLLSTVLLTVLLAILVGCNASDGRSPFVSTEESGTTPEENRSGPEDPPAEPPEKLGLCEAKTYTQRVYVESACDGDSWTGGMVELCEGTLWYRDYVFDDYGADEDGRTNRTVGALNSSLGDKRYPPDTQNTADIVDISIRVEAGELIALFELNALYLGTETTAILAIDTDNDRQTGGGQWPGYSVRSDGWEIFETSSIGDVDNNTIEIRIPMPPGDSWYVQAATAQADGTIMNVAFRGTEEEVGPTARGGDYWDNKQARALAEGDISEFGQCIEVNDLTSGTTKPALIPAGLHLRVVTSMYTIGSGEGRDFVNPVPGEKNSAGTQEFHFMGPYQPMGIYLPDRPGPHGLQLVLHGSGNVHSAQIDGEGLRMQFGEDRNRILISPLARGPSGWYSDISERDVLDALDDVIDRYDIDTDKVFAGGYSMGGYGAMRMAMLYPHRFAGLLNWVGFTGDTGNAPSYIPPRGQGERPSGAVGNILNFTRNLRNIPSAHLYAAADELVFAWTALDMQEELEEQEVPFQFYFHLAEHLTFATLDEWAKESAYSAGWSLVKNPAHITYRTEPWQAFPEYQIIHNKAYWMSEISGRETEKGDYVDIDITSFACETERPLYETGERRGNDPVPWYSSYREIVGSEPVPQYHGLSGTFQNVADLLIDMEPACLGSAPVHYSFESDGDTTIRLSDGRIANLKAGSNDGWFE